MAFWLPSGWVTPVEPTNMPGLMSAIVDFTIATNSGLSVTVSFSSAPSRFLTTYTGPSTRSMVPRIRTVSCADAGKAMQIKAKLKAASVRCTIPYMMTSRILTPDFGDGLPATPPTPGYSGIKAGNWLLGSCRAATVRKRLFDVDSCILDQLAPALFLATHISIEFLRRARDHDEPLIHGQLLE